MIVINNEIELAREHQLMLLRQHTLYKMARHSRDSNRRRADAYVRLLVVPGGVGTVEVGSV